MPRVCLAGAACRIFRPEAHCRETGARQAKARWNKSIALLLTFRTCPMIFFSARRVSRCFRKKSLFFEKMPSMLSVYQALRDQLVKRCPELQIKVSKTQISFRNRHIFAMASLPFRRAKGWPECCLIVSFGLCCRLDSPRIVQAVEPYPNRWTHHVLVTQCAEIDAELLAWLDEAYRFAMAK